MFNRTPRREPTVPSLNLPEPPSLKIRSLARVTVLRALRYVAKLHGQRAHVDLPHLQQTRFDRGAGAVVQLRELGRGLAGVEACCEAFFFFARPAHEGIRRHLRRL